METAGIWILLLFLGIGFVGVFLGIFGTLIILLSTFVYAIATGFEAITIKFVLLLLFLYLLGEILEYVMVIIGAKKFGASNKAAVGAVIGGIVGAIFGTFIAGIGLIPATFLGLFLGAFLVEYLFQRDLVKSLKAGAGGIFGRIGAIASKVIIALIMIFLILKRLF